MGAYDLDFHAWAFAQAEALRRRSANDLDWENIAEEVESLGRQQRSELRKRLVVLLAHLLKWEFQPRRRGRSWTNTIFRQRADLDELLEGNPSLLPARDELFSIAYVRARKEAALTTRLPLETFPESPPFTLAQAIDPDWLPGSDAP